MNNSGYSYDEADRLTSWIRGSTTASYVYDGDGLRASKTVNGTGEAFVYDLAEGMPLIIQDGTTKYVTGPGGLPLEQVTSSGSVLYYLEDQLGSTRGLIDGSGNVAATSTYGPYGDLRGQTGTASNPFGYAGQYTDSESGLQYLRTRYYDPATEQFLSVDPLVAGSGEPYAYTGGNPLNATDPTGLCSWGDSLDCVVQGAVGFLKTQPLPTQMVAGWELNGLINFIGTSHRDLTSPNPVVKLIGIGYVYANVYLAFLPVAGGLQNLVRGAEGCSIGGIDATEASLSLSYKAGWSAEQIAAADAKVAALNDAARNGLLQVTKVERSGTSAATMWRSAGGDIPAGSDIDHTIDLQLGGSNSLENLSPLDYSVNRSLGPQIACQIRGLEPGTFVTSVKIC